MYHVYSQMYKIETYVSVMNRKQIPLQSRPGRELDLCCHPRRPQLCFAGRDGGQNHREAGLKDCPPSTRQMRGPSTGPRFSGGKEHGALGSRGVGGGKHVRKVGGSGSGCCLWSRGCSCRTVMCPFAYGLREGDLLGRVEAG